MNLESIGGIDFAALRTGCFHPSPAAWEDQVLYFLMLDRFSDDQENGYKANDGTLVSTGSTPLFTPADAGNAVPTEAAAASWRDAGGRFCGGTLRGLSSKLGYLQRLGVTAIWVSPIFKQVAFDAGAYHGYGIQNFLAVDPHFGSADELRRMVAEAHKRGIRVILDIILNHSGNVFAYEPDVVPFWNGGTFPVAGYRDASGAPTLPFDAPLAAGQGSPDAAIWPQELQAATTFTRKGKIRSWDYDPEFYQGDFETLKDISLGEGFLDPYRPSTALKVITQAYKYWIAFADVDGFRIDTVKHMEPGATRYFASVIHEFAQSLGKENFYLIGEITGGRSFAFQRLEETGLDAALGVDDIPDKLEFLVKGSRNPEQYFDLFRNSLLVNKESHVWFRNKVVTLFDDHDQVRKGERKARFCAGDPAYARQVIAVLGMEATTLGIPLLYYGTEQAFDGEGGNDRYIRECQFGGDFGAFRSRGRHFFDESHPVYRETSRILALRKDKMALRRGRQYLRQISGDGIGFGYPRMFGNEIRSVVPWSRLFDGEEVLCAINTDSVQARTVWSVIDHDLHRPGEHFRCAYSTDAAEVGTQLPVEDRGPTRAVRLTVPAAGFVIYEKAS
ncbi:MAG: alpha-amylase [Candidatus Accumulibacter phosphatis]|mgnify:FL=1|uniref:Alpha-amylase n=1 Tax=Candidatus Accumulibacter phosphatis TaxID=327160 RepID=A0A6A7RZD5_9PROT|nr:alpha-amylase [Candidatus Accumulibacter phosphatis]